MLLVSEGHRPELSETAGHSVATPAPPATSI